MYKNEWITVNEAIYLTGKSEPTIRRWVATHKNNKKAYKKENGKSLINSEAINQNYHFINDSQKTLDDDNKHKKEAMQIAYNSEIMKAQIEQLRAKDEHLKGKDRQIEEKDKQIKMLINKKSYVWLWLTIGFVILITVFGGLGYIYRNELINTYNSKISDITTSNQKEITNLVSSHQKEVNLLMDQLTDTKKSSSELIKEIKETNNKLSVSQQQTIKEKEMAVNRLQTKLDLLNK